MDHSYGEGWGSASVPHRQKLPPRTVALENYEIFISSHLALLETGVGERQTMSFQIKLYGPHPGDVIVPECRGEVFGNAKLSFRPNVELPRG